MTRNLPFDWLLFYSSVNSRLANAGQANDVAGGTFQDALVGAIQTGRPHPVKVVNWGYWGEIGSVASESVAGRLASIGLMPIGTKEGMDALDRVLACALHQVFAVKVDQCGRNNIDVIAAPAGLRGEAGNQQRSDPFVVSDAVPSESPEQYVRRILQEVLGVDAARLRPDESFAAYGIDSIVGLRIVARLQRDIGRLPTTLLFEHRTLGQLSAYIAERHAGAPLIAPVSPPAPAPAPRIAALRGARAAGGQRAADPAPCRSWTAPAGHRGDRLQRPVPDGPRSRRVLGKPAGRA